MEKLNNELLRGGPTQLNEFFHKYIVFLSQDFKELGRGVDNCIQSY